MRSITSVRCRVSVQLIVAIAIFVITSGNVHACGRDTDCKIGDRSYRIAMPEGRDASVGIGAVIFVHGYRGKSAGVMQHAKLISSVTDLGLAFVAAQAAGPEWQIPGVPSGDFQQGVDELDYFEKLKSALVKRFNVDPKRVMVSGFSSGAMMVWHLACYRGAAFVGFVPMSGTFWAPLPKTCPTASVNLIHYHGKEDPIVPILGRPIKDSRQGNVYEAIELFARLGQFHSTDVQESSGLECFKRVNDAAKQLELCMFSGKHELRPRYIQRAWRNFQSTMR